MATGWASSLSPARAVSFSTASSLRTTAIPGSSKLNAFGKVATSCDASVSPKYARFFVSPVADMQAAVQSVMGLDVIAFAPGSTNMVQYTQNVFTPASVDFGDGFSSLALSIFVQLMPCRPGRAFEHEFIKLLDVFAMILLLS